MTWALASRAARHVRTLAHGHVRPRANTVEALPHDLLGHAYGFTEVPIILGMRAKDRTQRHRDRA